MPQESVGGGAPHLFPPLPLPLPRLPRPRLVETGGIASADARAPDLASVSGTCCDVRRRACLAPRWGTVRANKTTGCGAAAGSPRARASSSFFLPLHYLFQKLQGSQEQRKVQVRASRCW